MPYIVKETPFVASQAIVSRSPSNVLRSECVDYCGAISSWCSLVGLGWPTVTKVVMAIIPQDFIKITDTLCNIEGQLKDPSVSSANLCERLSLSSTVTVT